MYVAAVEKALESHAASVRTARYSSAGDKSPSGVDVARVTFPPTVEAAVVRIFSHANFDASGDKPVAFTTREAPVDVLSRQAMVSVLDSRRNVLAVNVPAAYSESDQEASVTLAPTPRTRAPARTARTRVKVRWRETVSSPMPRKRR